MNGKVTVNLLDLGSKARSKYELYKLLTNEANLYLPPYKECSIEFITDYLEGKKSVLKTSEVTVKSIPYFKGLRSEDLYAFLVEECKGQDYLPEVKHHRFPNRQWLSNIANSINPEGLENLIQNAMQRRQEKMLEDKRLTIQVDNDLANVIFQSKSISTRNGRSHYLLNTKAREDWRQKKSILREWPNQQELMEGMREEIKNLRAEIQSQQKKIQEGEQNDEILNSLYKKGIIDEEGNLID